MSPAPRGLPLAGLCCTFLLPLVALGQSVEVGSYRLISSKRVTRTIYQDVYQADASNWTDSDASISAILTSLVPQITVVEGGLSFGDLTIGATATSTDTFTVRHDRSKPFDVDGLVWTPTVTPLAPTTSDLIEQDLAAGILDDETALLYRVYDEFNDARLPAQYEGRDEGAAEASATSEAAGRFASLSASTQSLIAPFLLELDAPGSWYQARVAQNAAPQTLNAAPRTARARRLFAPVRTAEAAPSPFSFIGGAHVQVWWDNKNFPDNQARAKAVSDEVERVWPKLTGLLGVPKSDLGVPGVRGEDPRLDIMIVDPRVIARLSHVKTAEAVDLDYSTTCTDQAPTYILISMTSTFPTIIHEVTHAILKGFKLKTGCDMPEYYWMHEATATWAEHFIYPKTNSEHGQAPAFLSKPAVELESLANIHHRYGAYLWFFYVTRGGDAGAHYVRETWDAAATNDSLQSVNQAILGLGGLAEEWPQFALYNWNRRAKFSFDESGGQEIGTPYRYYAKWDGLIATAAETTPAAVKAALNGKTTRKYPLNFTIPHLAASYFQHDFRGDKAIRSVTLNQPYAGGINSRARVEVIAKIKDKDWEAATDWTPYPSKTLCLDKPTERVEEMIVVVTNSEFTSRGTNVAMKTPQDGPMELEVSAVGCQPWIGKIDFTRTVDLVPDDANGQNGRQIRESASTNVTFELAPVTGGVNNNVYVPTSVLSTWNSSGEFSNPEQDCSGHGSGIAQLGPNDSGELITLFLPPPLGDGSTLYYQGLGYIDPRLNGMDIPYTCADGTVIDTTYGDGRNLTWWATRPLTADPDSNEAAILDANGDLVMRGDFQRQEGDPSVTLVVEKWHWELKQPKPAP